MGIDLWSHSKFLHHKVRNMTRRGWLLKTYNDKKMLSGRVKTGEKIENDELDIISPVGYVSHVKPSGKTEIITMDIGADTSRRVILSVMGDREEVPQPDENESFFYSPGNKKQFLRHKKKKDQGGGGGGGREFEGVEIEVLAAGGSQKSKRQTKDSGRVSGMHWDGDDQKVSGQNKETFQMKSDKGIGYKTDANYDIKAGGATQFEAGKHVMKGTVYHGSDTFTSGVEHAADHVAGGGASVGSLPSARVMPYAMGGGSGLPEGTPDGSQSMSASGQPGTISLKGMAGAMGMSSVGSDGSGQPTGGGMMGQMNQMQQQQQQQAGDLADIIRRLEKLEALHGEQVKVLPHHTP